MTKKLPVVFVEGWADELDLGEEEYMELVRGITQLVETGEIFEESVSVDDLDDEEREEILAQLNKPKNTRH